MPFITVEFVLQPSLNAKISQHRLVENFEIAFQIKNMAEEDDHHLSFKEGCNMNTTLDQMSKFQIFAIFLSKI